MTRMLVFDAADSFLYEISPSEIMTAYVTDEVGGEHCLDVATTRRMEQAQRLVVDVGGKWREYVVIGVDELHESGYTAVGSYHAVWSIQYDLSTVYGDEQRPGVLNPVAASVALQSALDGTTRWTVGTVTVTGSAGLEMYNNSAWERVCGVSGTWGGEIDAEITVGANKVIRRRVQLVSSVGSSTVTRRFDWSRDMTSIRRKPQEGPRYCRVKPIGKGEESGDGYGRKITIGPVNGGNDWIQDNAAAALYRVPDGSGGWEYPTLLVENSNIDDRQKLKEWATAHLHDWTRPVPTYEADVLQYAAAGMDVQGVALGDVVHVVDRGFGDEELRLEGRVVRMVTNLIDKSDVQLTIGQMGQRLSKSLGSIAQSVGEVKSILDVMYVNSGGSPTTSEYVSWLVQQVNARLNATGGYTYFKEGEGIWIYDKAEDQNPTKVINLTGGALRIADSKTSGGDWAWKTVMTASDGLLASAVTAAQLTAGYIGSPSGNYWNLDTGELRMSSGYFVDGQGDPISIDELIDAAQTAGDIMPGGTNLLNGTNELSVLGNPEWSVGGWAGEGDSTKGARKVINVDCPSNNVTRGFQLYSLDPTDNQLVYQTHVPITRGEKYVLSVYCKGTGKLRVGIGATSYEVEPSSIYNRYYIKFVADENNTLSATQTQISFAQAARGTLNVCGMKLERGNVASDWSASPIDQQRHANKAANSALAQADAHAVELADDAVAYAKAETTKQVTEGINLAKEYTNDISELDRAYTAEQSQAVKDYFTQAEIFNRLTKNGTKKGVYLSNGELYINGTYIRSGVIDANLIKAGIIADNLATPKNIWNLATGYFETKNAVMKNANVTGQFSCGSGNVMELKNGTLTGYFNGSNVGQINYMKSYRDVKSGQSFKGLYLASGGGIGVFTPRFATGTSTSSSTTGTYGKTGTYTIKNVAHDIKSKSDGISWKYGTLKIKVINGLITSISGLDGSWS